jgi:hypothetical protein
MKIAFNSDCGMFSYIFFKYTYYVFKFLQGSLTILKRPSEAEGSGGDDERRPILKYFPVSAQSLAMAIQTRRAKKDSRATAKTLIRRKMKSRNFLNHGVEDHPMH